MLSHPLAGGADVVDPGPCHAMLAGPMNAANGSTAIARDALGIGLRPVHYAALFAEQPALDYLEVISDNFIGDAAPARRNLEHARSRYPIVLHGVGLNLLGHAPLDEGYLDAIARLADRLDAPFVTDHLCWTGAHGMQHHDLLPAPYTADLVDFAASRARYVQERIGRPFGLENLSTYVELAASTMSEHAFYTSVIREAGCWFMLDINNIYVSSQNHGLDPVEYLEAIDFTRVLQVHLAGHTRLSDGTIIDTHDHPVCEEVWALYAKAWRMGGPFPTLIEWDADIPPLAELLDQLARARAARSRVRA
jgi:uncharacterized protein (UPF0276 family)